MATCRCGKVTIKAAKVTPAHVPAKKVTPTRVAPAKVAPTKTAKKSAASIKATRAATKKALARPNPYAGGCSCS